MPAVTELPAVLVDTSAAVALLVADHEHHVATRSALGSRSAGLAGHAAFETFSVLTRLPPPLRRTPAVVMRLLVANFPSPCLLSAGAGEDLWRSLPRLGIAGGAVYDALVGAAAGERGVPLLTATPAPWRPIERSGSKLSSLPSRA